MGDKTFVRLNDLVGKTFTVKHVHGYSFKMWDNESRKMVMDNKWFKGSRKVYQIETDKGFLDLGQTQLANILETVFDSGIADINLETFEVKSNGKTGMDIRYMFRRVRKEVEPVGYSQEDINSIPF